MYKVGIDLGGTKIEGIVLDDKNNEIIRKRVPTEQEQGYDHILRNIKQLQIDLTGSLDDNYTFGVGTPGAISRKTQLMKNSNTTCLNGRPIQQDLEALLKRNIAIENDANCFAMAEAMLGAGKGYKSVFGVIMGTGCGGGIVYDGEVIKGNQSIAGEWGHMTIDPKNGPPCYCGKKGCVERYISGGGLESLYESTFGEKKKLSNIMLDFRKGEARDYDFVQNFMERFGVALSNVLTILDPDIVVLGGGVSNIEELYTLGIEQVRRYIFNDALETQIVKNKCGDSAGVLGAAFIGI
ncbi:MAG TPA: ROK family protein [Cytophagaceae bacterium]|jgi:fructokinase